MTEDNVLVSLTASREKGEIVYRVECSSSLSQDEFEYYLSEITKASANGTKTSAKTK